MYKKELQIAKIAAEKAGQMLKKEFLGKKNNTIKFKSNSERVTLFDKKSEKISYKFVPNRTFRKKLISGEIIDCKGEKDPNGKIKKIKIKMP